MPPPEPTPQMIPADVKQLLVWKDVLIALTVANDVWILRGLNVWPPGTERPALEWVKLESRLAPTPAVMGDQPGW